MTARDYETIAVCIRAEAEHRHVFGAVLLYSLANRIAVELAIDNPRFDRDRFMAACGVEV